MTFCERGLKPVDLPNIQIVNLIYCFYYFFYLSNNIFQKGEAMTLSGAAVAFVMGQHRFNLILIIIIVKF